MIFSPKSSENGIYLRFFFFVVLFISCSLAYIMILFVDSYREHAGSRTTDALAENERATRKICRTVGGIQRIPEFFSKSVCSSQRSKRSRFAFFESMSRWHTSHASVYPCWGLTRDDFLYRILPISSIRFELRIALASRIIYCNHVQVPKNTVLSRAPPPPITCSVACVSHFVFYLFSSLTCQFQSESFKMYSCTDDTILRRSPLPSISVQIADIRRGCKCVISTSLSDVFTFQRCLDSDRHLKKLRSHVDYYYYY